ncbi:hypothetical protein [Pannonibacter phragmitetus]|uniref:hypothetical protein n=1 Tax=Pannonibacter phragmitetus TaxID=121719 RepID=UPI0011C01E78|nr:hypothetical protein [Pannonibacter phragmitetus]
MSPVRSLAGGQAGFPWNHAFFGKRNVQRQFFLHPQACFLRAGMANIMLHENSFKKVLQELFSGNSTMAAF